MLKHHNCLLNLLYFTRFSPVLPLEDARALRKRLRSEALSKLHLFSGFSCSNCIARQFWSDLHPVEPPRYNSPQPYILKEYFVLGPRQMLKSKFSMFQVSRADCLRPNNVVMTSAARVRCSASVSTTSSTVVREDSPQSLTTSLQTASNCKLKLFVLLLPSVPFLRINMVLLFSSTLRSCNVHAPCCTTPDVNRENQPSHVVVFLFRAAHVTSSSQDFLHILF